MKCFYCGEKCFICRNLINRETGEIKYSYFDGNKNVCSIHETTYAENIRKVIMHSLHYINNNIHMEREVSLKYLWISPGLDGVTKTTLKIMKRGLLINM